MLKAELRNMERMKKREGVDMTYLKNVILKLLETGICLKKNKIHKVQNCNCIPLSKRYRWLLYRFGFTILFGTKFTGEVEALLPVIGTLLQFSPDEVKWMSYLKTVIELYKIKIWHPRITDVMDTLCRCGLYLLRFYKCSILKSP